MLAALCLLSPLTGCSENYTHDPDLAAQKAVEFAEATFVQRDLKKGYALLADKARAYVPIEKFRETVAAMHNGRYPGKIAVVGAAPIKGEKRVSVILRGEGAAGAFDYTLSLVGTTEAGYRVTTFNGGALSSLPAG
jgi:hypothetical protein